MLDEIVERSEKLLKDMFNLSKFQNKYDIFHYNGFCRLRDEAYKIAEDIPTIEKPSNQEELWQSEIKKRLQGDAMLFEKTINPSNLDYETVLSIYNIPKEDLEGLREWLIENKERTAQAIDRLYRTREIEDFELNVHLDIPGVRRQAEEFANVHIEKYHKHIGKFLQNLTEVGGYLRDIDAVPTLSDRSYFHSLSEFLAISIPSICRQTEDKGLHIKEKELIKIYGHEGMGHAMNKVIAKNSNLPYILANSSALTISSEESLAQFYEEIIFEDIKNSPELQKQLGIKSKFDEIYQEAQDSFLLSEYKKKMYNYAIMVVANNSYGDPWEKETIDRKKEELSKVSIDPVFVHNFVEKNRTNFDSQGNLDPTLVSQLIYGANPVQRALEEFEKKGFTYEGENRSKIDSVLLSGYWTPQSYVDHARISAKDL